MKKAFVMLPLAFACATQFAVAAPTDAERIALIEQELAVLKEANQAESIADRITVNGFFTGKAGIADNNAGYNGYTDEIDFEEGSKLGIQGTFALTEQTKIVSQLIARGDDNWSTSMEWAFLSHDFENGLVTRIGRLRAPIYMYSDYLDVGYAQPWITPPSELYSVVPISAFDGVDVLYDMPVGEATLTFQAIYGEAVYEDDDGNLGSDLDFSQTAGLVATVGYEDWTFRSMYFTTDVSADATTLAGEFDKNNAYFTGVGVGYDNGELIVVSEYAMSDVQGDYSDTKSGYLTVGYRIDAFTPYATYSFLKSTDNAERTGLNQLAFNWKRTAYSVGTRYDISSNLSFKADITYATDFDNTNGGLYDNVDLLTGTFPEDDTLVYSVSFDAVF